MSKKVKIYDGIENIKTSLGGSKDAKAYTEFAEVTLDVKEIETAYRFDWILAKAVEIPAKDMTKKWLLFSGKSKHIELIKEHYKTLEVKKIVRKALIYKALYGASYIVIESNLKSLKSRLKRSDTIKKLHIEHKYDFDKKSDIHESRIYTMEQNEFQDSILYKTKESILNLLTSLEIPASLMHKADIDFISIKGLAVALAKCKKDKNCRDAEEKIQKRIQAMYEQMSMFKMGIKDSEESFENFNKNLSGYDALQMVYMNVVAGATDIPLTRFFGTAPKGMNATGQGDLTNYHESLSAMQDEFVEDFLEKINDVIFSSNDILKPKFSFEFAPIKDMTKKELVEIQKDEASIIALFIDELDPETIAEAISRLDVFKNIKVVSSGKES